MRPARTAFIFASAVAACLVVLADTAAADSVRVSNAKLPTPRFGSAAASDGTFAYVLGGDDGALGVASTQILRYDPDLDLLVVQRGVLPGARINAVAIWDGHAVYVLGGRGSADDAAVLRYDPILDIVTQSGARLPHPVELASAAWDGTSAYLFGGHAGTAVTTGEIVRFTPGNLSVSLLPTRLPVALTSTSATYDGRYAYVFGGSTATAPSDKIYRFDPTDGSIVEVGATLGTPRRKNSAVWGGSHAFIFGGDESNVRDEILHFDPAEPRVFPSDAKMLSGLFTASAWLKGHAYLFGGLGPTGGAVNVVADFTPSSGTGTMPSATPGPTASNPTRTGSPEARAHRGVPGFEAVLVLAAFLLLVHPGRRQ